MANILGEITEEQLNHYVFDIIPKLEQKMVTTTDKNEMLESYQLYLELLRITAVDNFISYMKYLEIDEDKNSPFGGFYHKRKKHLASLFETLNDMEIYDKYDTLLVSMPPRVGKTRTNLLFITWIIGRHPLSTQLAISYSEAITKSFYNGVMEIIMNQRWQEVFPNSKLVAQNAKDENIWLGKFKQYPSISFIPIGGSMTGRGQGSEYIFYDDLVSGIEEAISPTRLENLWSKYTTNAQQRKMDGCKEIHIATRWSVNDPMTRIERNKQGEPKFKNIKLSCYNEKGESQFDFKGGFTTQYYKDIEKTMDKISFNALYLQNPMEREGLVFKEDELQRYFKLPNERPDSIIAVCDSKNLGKDYVASPIGYVYGDLIYLEDVVFNNGLPELTKPLVANKAIEHNVVRLDVEMNNGGEYYAKELQDLINEKHGNTSVRTFFTSSNKLVKIVTFSDFIKKHIIFKDKSCYEPTSEYGKFMQNVLSFTQTGKNTNDDAPDSLAMLAQLYQDLTTTKIKILNRKELGF